MEAFAWRAMTGPAGTTDAAGSKDASYDISGRYRGADPQHRGYRLKRAPQSVCVGDDDQRTPTDVADKTHDAWAWCANWCIRGRQQVDPAVTAAPRRGRSQELSDQHVEA